MGHCKCQVFSGSSLESVREAKMMVSQDSVPHFPSYLARHRLLIQKMSRSFEREVCGIRVLKIAQSGCR